jgi:hypothetical protein
MFVLLCFPLTFNNLLLLLMLTPYFTNTVRFRLPPNSLKSFSTFDLTNTSEAFQGLEEPKENVLDT